MQNVINLPTYEQVEEVKEKVTGQKVAFTVAGTFTWKCPNGVNRVYVTATGGGGGGGGGSTSSTAKGGGGAVGPISIDIPIDVVAGESYTITVGVGGNGGARGQRGEAGGSTSFDKLLTVPGGKQGSEGSTSYGNGGSCVQLNANSMFYNSETCAGASGVSVVGGSHPLYGVNGGNGSYDNLSAGSKGSDGILIIRW